MYYVQSLHMASCTLTQHGNNWSYAFANRIHAFSRIVWRTCANATKSKRSRHLRLFGWVSVHVCESVCVWTWAPFFNKSRVGIPLCAGLSRSTFQRFLITVAFFVLSKHNYALALKWPSLDVFVQAKGAILDTLSPDSVWNEAIDRLGQTETLSMPIKQMRTRKILFVGWRRDMADMIRTMDMLVHSGSELWLFNSVPAQVLSDIPFGEFAHVAAN